MARMQSGGGTYASSLAFLGIGFVLSIVLAIVFFAQLSGAHEKAQTAENKLREYVSSAEEKSDWISNYRAGRSTIVGRLHDETVQLKAIIGTSADKQAEVIENELTRRNIDVSLISYVNDLENEQSVLNNELQNLRDQLDKAVAARDQANQEMEQLGKRFEAAISKLTSKVDQQADLVKIIEQWLVEVNTELEQGAQQTIAGLQDENNRLDAEVSRLQKQVRDLAYENSLLKGKGGKVALKKLTQPDGRIVTVLSDERKVYIDRGHDDHMILGMTFEVFDNDELILLEEGENQQLRGKATIEVVDIDEKASTARIVRRSRNVVVKEGDAVANLVYDPDATMKFYVHGEFDIENTGQTLISDYKRVLSMIQRWGGVVADDLTYDVDFLILGKEPPIPEPIPEGVIDLRVIEEYSQRKQDYNTYQELIEQARRLDVPILNQNRFLVLVGHYQR